MAIYTELDLTSGTGTPIHISGAIADIPATPVPVGSTFWAHDENKVYKTYDGMTWVATQGMGVGTASGVLKMVSVTKALVAASAYDAGDVLSQDADNGEGTAWTFSAIARFNAAGGYIVKAHVMSETTALTPRLVLYLFNATPTCELDDHAANTALLWADKAKYIGRIDFPALSENGTGASESIATPSTSGNLPLAFECAAGADDLIGVLVTLDAFTQTPGDDMTIVLTVEQF